MFINRVWDTTANGFVVWKTPDVDSTGADYPGPGAFGVDTSDFCVIGGSKETPQEHELLARTSSELITAVATLGTDTGRIRVAGDITLAAGLTVGSSITLFIPAEASISIPAGTLTINGPLEAEPYQIFTAGQDVVLSGANHCVYPQWFGAVADGATDDLPAIQAAIDSLATIDGGVVKFPAGIYRVSDALNLTDDITLAGVGTGVTVLQNTTGVGSMLQALVGARRYRVRVQNMTLDGNSNSAVGLDLGRISQASIADLQISNCTVGVYMVDEAFYNILSNVTCSTVGTGFLLNDGASYGPADNTFIFCRVNGASNGFILERLDGGGLSSHAIYSPTVENFTGTAFAFSADAASTCRFITVVGARLENAAPAGTGFNIGANVDGTTIVNPYFINISTEITDNGDATLIEQEGKHRGLRVMEHPSVGDNHALIKYDSANTMFALRAAGDASYMDAWLGRVQGNTSTAATPTYSYVGDPDSGTYSGGADTIGWSCGGTMAGYINASTLAKARTGAAAVLLLDRTEALGSPSDIGLIQFRGTDTGGGKDVPVYIVGKMTSVGAGSEYGALTIETMVAGAAAADRLTVQGGVIIGDNGTISDPTHGHLAVENEILAGNGTVGGPSFGFRSEVTGMYLHSAGTIGFGIAGALGAYLNASTFVKQGVAPGIVTHYNAVHGDSVTIGSVQFSGMDDESNATVYGSVQCYCIEDSHDPANEAAALLFNTRYASTNAERCRVDGNGLTFTTLGTTNGDISFVARSGDPSAPSEGEVWYDGTDDLFKGRDDVGVIPFHALPGSQAAHTIFVCETASTFTADGSANAPYALPSTALAAAEALSPTSSNRIEIVVLPGMYDDTLLLDAVSSGSSYISIVGLDPATTVIVNTTSSSTSVVNISDNSNITFKNLTLRTTGTGYSFTASGSGTGPAEFDNVWFEATADNATGFVRCSANQMQFHFRNCKMSHAYPARPMLFLNGSAVVGTLSGCKVTGYFAVENGDIDISDSTFYSTATEGVIDINTATGTDIELRGCKIEGTTNARIHLSVDISSLRCLGCDFVGTTAPDIDASTTVDAVTVKGCSMSVGIDSNVKTTDTVKYVGGDFDFYENLESAVTAATAGCVIELLGDDALTNAIAPAASSDITINGNGNTISRSSGIFTLTNGSVSLTVRDAILTASATNDVLSVSAASADVLIDDCELTGDVTVSSTSDVIELRGCDMVGGIDVAAGCDAQTIIRVVRTRVAPPAATGFPIYIADADPTIIVWGSHLQATTSNGATAAIQQWSVQNDNVKIAYSKFYNSTVGSDPFATNTNQPTYSGHHNTRGVGDTAWANNISTPYDVIDTDSQWGVYD